MKQHKRQSFIVSKYASGVLKQLCKAPTRAMSISISDTSHCGPLHQVRSYEFSSLKIYTHLMTPAIATKNPIDNKAITVHLWRGSTCKRKVATTGRMAIHTSDSVLRTAMISIARLSFKQWLCGRGGHTQYALIGLVGISKESEKLVAYIHARDEP